MLIYSMENTLKNYGDRGFVPLMLLNVKGMVAEGERTKLENWWNRLLNFGFKERAKVTNGEAVEAVPLGAGMEELKGSYTEIRRTAEESIADAFGIPSALFMSDNAYASEFVELRKQWYSSSRFVSLYQTIQEVMTDQLYKAYGYKWRFALETLDIFQADESKRALSLASIVQAVTTDPAAAQFGMGVLGYDLTKEQQDQLDEIITTKEEEKEQLQEQIAAGQVDMNGKPIAQKPKGEQEKESRDSERQDTEKKPPKRKALEPEQVAALATWQKNAVRWYEHSGGTKNGADWRCDLPDDIAAPIRAKLQAAKTIEDVRSAFVVTITDTPAPVYAPPTMSYSDDAVKALAQAIERAAESTKAEPQAPPNYTLNLTAQMPAAGEPTINFSPVIQPSEVKAEPSVIVNVEPTPVTVQNDVTVQPADVTVIDKGKHKATVKRDRDGNITGIEAK
jgi:Spy/CpxP family protein refolding chaperone